MKKVKGPKGMLNETKKHHEKVQGDVEGGCWMRLIKYYEGKNQIKYKPFEYGKNLKKLGTCRVLDFTKIIRLQVSFECFVTGLH